MKISLISVVLVAAATSYTANCFANDGNFTLYRNSVTDRSMRIHVGTFDAVDGEKYNSGNCDLAATLFASQAGVIVRFWCERGPYKRWF